jgi:hypothetical protein
VWKDVPSSTFHSLEHAQDSMRANFPTLLQRATIKDQVVDAKKKQFVRGTLVHLYQYQCKGTSKKWGLCKGRINQIIAPNKVDCCIVTSQIVIFDGCLCQSSQPVRRGVSGALKSKINRILGRGMHLQPQQIVLMVLNDITNIDDMHSPTLIGTNTDTAETRATLFKQITSYVKMPLLSRNTTT